jgi:hypothetical protein
VTGNPALTIWIYPTAGEPFAVTTTDFDTEKQAANKLALAFRYGRPLRLIDRSEHEGDATLVLNTTNVIAIRVRSAVAGSKTGQYL